MTLDFKPGHEPVTQADFMYSITPDTISITDTCKGRLPVANDIQTVLQKIEHWHQGPVAGFRIMYRDVNGVWDGQHPSFFAIGETHEGKAMEKAVEGLRLNGESGCGWRVVCRATLIRGNGAG
jgi:hypothetical protein